MELGIGKNTFTLFLLLEFCTLWLLHFDCCARVSTTCVTVSSLTPKLDLILIFFLKPL